LIERSGFFHGAERTDSFAPSDSGAANYDDIFDCGEAHLSFLRGFAEFHYGIPCAEWLRAVMNRIAAGLFAACFPSWARRLLAGPTDPAPAVDLCRGAILLFLLIRSGNFSAG